MEIKAIIPKRVVVNLEIDAEEITLILNALDKAIISGETPEEAKAIKNFSILLGEAEKVIGVKDAG